MLDVKAGTLAELNAAVDPVTALLATEDGGPAAAFLSPKARKALAEQAKEEGFTGKAGETVSFKFRDGDKERRYVLVGLGKRKDAGTDAHRKAGAALYRAYKTRFETLWLAAGAQAAVAAEGLWLGSYAFTNYKKPDAEPKLKLVRLVCASAGEAKKVQSAVDRAALGAEAVTFTRDLVNLAPSDKSPEAVAEVAKSLAGGDVTVEVIDRKQAEKQGMNLLVAVGRGAERGPRMVHLTYKPKGAKRKVALVGKGITFDSGGLSLKPPASMETMKMDMAGAALVLGVFKVLARLKVKAEVHGYAALAYNLPGPDAVKPGDVIKGMNGKTVEILNTDAEGRLVLADALHLAASEKPSAILDYATLTGAALVALGSGITAAMTNDRALLAKVTASSKRCDEAIWELPLPKDYEDMIKSKIADLLNIGKVRGEAGTIVGGLFLREFVGDVPWVHLDIAGPAWTDGGTALSAPGGTGALVRTTLDWLGGL
ncbi:MAG: leucyl aminopeptidase [Elusimicrobia bacterium]|nr:leucyl aminopeptidase [Elusimicrobiota bacterium]